MKGCASRIPYTACLAAFLLIATTSAGQEKTLENCASLVREVPGDPASYKCYADLARMGKRGEAVRALEAILLIDPERHYARAFLGIIEAYRGAPRGEGLIAEAAEGLAAQGNAEGEGYTRLQLGNLLLRAERFAEAETEFARAEAAAERAGDQNLQARIWLDQSRLARQTGDHARFLQLLRRAERVAFPDGLPDLRSGILSMMGYQYWQEGRLGEAREAYLRQAELLQAVGDRYEEVVARYNIVLLSRRLMDRGHLPPDEYVRDIRAVIERAVETGNRRIESRARHLLGQELPGEDGIRELELSLEISRAIGYRSGERESRRFLAYRLWSHGPERRDAATRLIEEAIEDARSTGNLRDIARGLTGRAGMLANGGEREEWIEAHAEAIEAVEKMRNLHPGGPTGARLFSSLSFVYYRFVGKLLEGLPVSPDPEGDLDLAWRTLERMRTRSWIEALDRSDAHPRGPQGSGEGDRRAEVLGEIVEIQKKLADDSLPDGPRSELLAELGRLEAEEAVLRGELAGTDPGFDTLFSPRIAGLDELRESLAPDQAILSYLLSSGSQKVSESGSWCFLVTRAGVSVHPLEHRLVLQSRIAILQGLLRRRDGSEAHAAARLYDDLLAEPLREIDPTVRKLLIVPDELLNEVPFAALRPSAAEDPLGARFSISRALSVTFWLRAGQGGDAAAPSRSPGAVLSLAVPDLGVEGAGQALRSSDPWLEGLRLERLPRALSEARLVTRNLGGPSLAVTGAGASERFLKGADLGPFDILHFAAHAVVDLDHPERSAVILPPGSEEEDGFLQMRDITQLDLRGKVVLLSACRSASGTALRGAGLQGLSRAFFQAGALAVIGNLWPLYDDEAEALMDDLSQHIAEGMSLGEAVSATRVSRIEAGEPAAVWANLVVLGAGDLVPVPGGRGSGGWLRAWGGSAALAALLLCVAVFAFRRLRAR